MPTDDNARTQGRVAILGPAASAAGYVPVEVGEEEPWAHLRGQA